MNILIGKGANQMKCLMKKVIPIFIFSLTFFSCEGSGTRNGKDSQSQMTKKEEIQPKTTSEFMQIGIKPIINIYVENSVSMDGYVKGTTEFEQAVYSYLSDIKISDLTNSFNLNYINSEILSQPDDVKNFIDKLEPNTFKLRGGNRAVTDISNILDSILKETSNNTISIFISDCVFSPGGSKDSEQYLINQQIGIKKSFATLLKTRDLAVIVYRLKSKFEGTYFNRFDKPQNINAQRPYFIWLLGNCSYLKELIKKIDKSKMKGSGVLNTYAIFRKCENLNYGILNTPIIGSFQRIDRTQIENARKDSDKKQFMFSVGINYSSLLLDDTYLTDPSNYIISDQNYSLEIVKSYTGSYTHTIKLHCKSNIISSTCVKIQLINKLPNWIIDFNDDIGTDINATGAMGKTYGLKYLIGGVYDAYTMDSNTYAEIIISIKQ